MKKNLISTICLLLGLALGIGLGRLLWSSSQTVFSPPTDLSVLVPSASLNTDDEELLQSEQAGIVRLAMYTAELIKAEDYEGLATVVHPEFGLIFSPYATVSLTSDLCFTADQVKDFPSDNNSYIWGQYDGSGDPISLKPTEYLQSFVWDRDYTQAPVVSLNHIVETGNALENMPELFPDAQFVELHFPKSGTQNDWRTLRLVFEKYGDTYGLTAIIHSEWTV